MKKYSDDQLKAIAAIRKWYKTRSWSPKPEFRLAGLAGTGKTTVTVRVARELGLPDREVIYTAPTNQARKVLTHELIKVGVSSPVSTLHKLLKGYREVHCPECPAAALDVVACHPAKECKGGCAQLFPDRYAQYTPGLVVVDEASMVNSELYDSLRERDWRVLFVGDHGQLPPVDDDLDLMAKPDFALETPHRAAAGSGIIAVAHMARNGEPIPFGITNGDVFRTDTIPIDWEDDSDSSLVLVHSNRARVDINRRARKALGRKGDAPEIGDKIHCRRSDHSRGILTGDMGIIEDIRTLDAHSYLAKIHMIDSGRLIGARISSLQFNNEERLKGMRGVSVWDYGYAITVNASQGSQADEVILFDASDWFKGKFPDQYRRWLYTGITRAAKRLTIAQRLG